MSNKNLFILAVVTAVLVLLAVVQSQLSDDTTIETGTPSYVLQGFDPDNIAKIIVGSGDDAITLQRKGGQFVVANKANYPADTEAVNGMLTQVLDLQSREMYTDNPDNFDELGVTEEKASSMVRFMKGDPNAPLLAGLIVGKSQELGQGTYIRLLPDDKVYICNKSPYIPSSVSGYYEQELVSVEEDDIASVTVKGPDAQYTLKKAEDGGDVVLENMPANRTLKQSDADRVFSALTSLRCEDVQQGGAGLTFNRQYVCRLENETVYTINIAQQDEETYVTVQAKYTGEMPTKSAEVESDEALKEKEAKLLAAEAAEKLATRHRGWVYKLTEWKAKTLVKPLDDLLEDEEEPEEAEDDAAAAAVEPDTEQDTAEESEEDTASVQDPNTAAVQDPNGTNQ